MKKRKIKSNLKTAKTYVFAVFIYNKRTPTQRDKCSLVIHRRDILHYVD